MGDGRGGEEEMGDMRDERREGAGGTAWVDLFGGQCGMKIRHSNFLFNPQEIEREAYEGNRLLVESWRRRTRKRLYYQ